MTVYLLHFDAPISDHHTTRHYLGYTNNLDRRLAEHRAGWGARLVEVATERGITFELVKTWTGGRSKERQLKNQKNGPRLCPVCRGRLGDDS